MLDNGAVTALLALGSRFDEVNVLAYLAAFGGGIVSFLSPCVLPLVPAYLSMVTGLDLAALQDSRRAQTRQVIRTTSLFVAGFGAVFVVLGLTASSLGQLFSDHQDTLTRISGAIMIGMGLFLLGSLFLRAPWLYQEKRFHPQLGRFGEAAPLVASDALVRLPLPNGGDALLACGVRDPGAYEPGQGTDVLGFLAAVAAIALTRMP